MRDVEDDDNEGIIKEHMDDKKRKVKDNNNNKGVARGHKDKQGKRQCW